MGIFDRFGSSKKNVKPMRLNVEEGFADFDFPLASAGEVDNGGWIFTARGLLNGQIVGFDVRLGGEWRLQEVDDGAFTVYWGSGAIIRTGEESDRFCALIQESYGIDGESREMPELVETMVASLGINPDAIRQEPLKMKMFVKPDGGENEYAEFFLNVDLPGQVLQFHEKDNEYRHNLIRAFSRPSR